MNGPLKNESLGKFYPSLGISQKFLMSLGVSDFVSVSHIFAFLLSHYTFSSRAPILRCQSQRLGKSRIYHSPLLYLSCGPCLSSCQSIKVCVLCTHVNLFYINLTVCLSACLSLYCLLILSCLPVHLSICSNPYYACQSVLQSEFCLSSY